MESMSMSLSPSATPFSSDLVIRPADVSERERELLEALQWRASLANEEHREDLLAHPDAIVLPLEHLAEGCALVAEREGEILGFSVVLSRDDGEAELDGLFVEPEAWGSGIGSRLVADAGCVASRRGSSFLWVVCGDRAVGFYAKCGFERAGETETRFGSAVSMRKRVADSD